VAAEAVAAVGAGAEVGEGVGVKVVEGAHPVLAAQVAAAAGAAEVARAAEAAAVTAVAANWLYPCRSSKREPHTQGPRKRSSKYGMRRLAGLERIPVIWKHSLHA